MTTKLQPGQRVWMIPSFDRGSQDSVPRPVTIQAVGRKWATVGLRRPYRVAVLDDVQSGRYRTDDGSGGCVYSDAGIAAYLCKVEDLRTLALLRDAVLKIRIVDDGVLAACQALGVPVKRLTPEQALEKLVTAARCGE